MQECDPIHIQNTATKETRSQTVARIVDRTASQQQLAIVSK